MLDILSRITVPIDMSDNVQILALIERSIRNRFLILSGPHLTLESIRTVSADNVGIRTVDIKRCVRVERLPSSKINGTRVLPGVMLNKDVAHPQMYRQVHKQCIHKPRIVLLDCPLEYKNGESRRMSRYRMGRILRGSIKGASQIMRSMSSPRRTSLRSDAYASQTTTGSRVQYVPRSCAV